MTCIAKSAYEGDIVSRLRNWRGLHLAHGGDLFEEAADEIERLRLAIRRLADQDATVSVQGGNVIVEMDSPCPYVTGTVTRYCTLTPFTLTDAEREAVEQAVGVCELDATDERCQEIAATLRGLLERLE